MKNGKRILKVVIKRESDSDADTSYYGEYGSRAESEYAIDRRHEADCQSIQPTNEEADTLLVHAADYLANEYPHDGDSFRLAVKSGLGVNEAIAALDDARESLTECDCGGVWIERNSYEFFNPCHENYAGESPEDIRKSCRQDYDRMQALQAGDWYYMGIRAEAEVMLTGSLSQEVTSGGLWGVESDSGDDYLKEIESEQLAELKEQLRAIGFSARAIATAFKNVTTEEN